MLFTVKGATAVRNRSVFLRGRREYGVDVKAEMLLESRTLRILDETNSRYIIKSHLFSIMGKAVAKKGFNAILDVHPW